MDKRLSTTHGEVTKGSPKGEKLTQFRDEAGRQKKVEQELKALYQMEEALSEQTQTVQKEIKRLSSDFRQSHVPNMEKYFKSVLEQSREVAKSAKIGQVTTEHLSERQKDLMRVQEGLNTFRTIMHSHHETPTVRDILDPHRSNIPEALRSDYASREERYWKKLIERQEGKEPTNSELKKFREVRSNHIANLVRGSSICIRTDATYLKEHLAQGHLEAKHARPNDNYAIQWGQNIYGFPHNFPWELRDLEGHLAPHEAVQVCHQNFKMRGGIIVRLKEHVARRTAITLGSPEGYIERTEAATNLTRYEAAIMGRPSPYDHPSVDAFALSMKHPDNSADSPLDPLQVKHIKDVPCRADILGGVPIDDIDEIVFTSPKYRDNELENLCEKLAIPHRMLEPHEYELNMTWVTEQFAVGGSPHPEEIQTLKAQGVDLVINMQEPDEKHYDKQLLKDNGIDFLPLPTPDHHPPTLDQLNEGVREAKKYLSQGKRVFVHCRDGVGRSPTLVSATLLETEGLTFSDTHELIGKQGRTLLLSRRQRERLSEFEAQYRAQQLGEKSD